MFNAADLERAAMLKNTAANTIAPGGRSFPHPAGQGVKGTSRLIPLPDNATPLVFGSTYLNGCSPTCAPAVPPR